jgi:hypothetical protein
LHRKILDEEESKCAGLAQEIGFGWTFIAPFAVAGKRYINSMHLYKRV